MLYNVILGVVKIGSNYPIIFFTIVLAESSCPHSFHTVCLTSSGGPALIVCWAVRLKAQEGNKESGNQAGQEARWLSQ